MVKKELLGCVCICFVSPFLLQIQNQCSDNPLVKAQARHDVCDCVVHSSRFVL